MQISRERVQHKYLKRTLGVSHHQIPVSRAFVLKYSIGTPPVESYGVPDTGSDLIWLQCEPCESCYGQTGTRFDIRASSTYDFVDCDSEMCSGFYNQMVGHCEYNVKYMDGSYSRGNIAQDIMTVPGQQRLSFSVLFGCGFNNSETSGERYPGIVGLRNSKRSLIQQLDSNAFSYCHGSKNDGSLRIGRWSARLLGLSTPLVQNNDGMYMVILHDIMVNNEGLNMPFYVFKHFSDKPSGVEIDSGAAIASLHPEAFTALLHKVSEYLDKKGKRMSLKGSLYCWDNLPGGIHDPSLPTISFMFRDLKLTLDDNAWYQHEEDICLAFLRCEYPMTIIGRHQLRNFNVGYDLKAMKLWLQLQSDHECPP